MKLVILFNFLLITTVTTAPYKRTKRKLLRYDKFNPNYGPYENTDICNNFGRNRGYQVECSSDSQTISLKLNTELGSISVEKSFETTNAEKKYPKRPYIHGYQGEKYSSDANSFSTSINLPYSSLSFSKSYRKVSGC